MHSKMNYEEPFLLIRKYQMESIITNFDPIMEEDDLE